MLSNLCYIYLSKEQLHQVDIVHSSRLMLYWTNEAGAQQMNKISHTGNSYDTHIWKLLQLTVTTICISLTVTTETSGSGRKDIGSWKVMSKKTWFESSLPQERISGFWQRLPMELLVTGPDSCLQLSPKGRWHGATSARLWYAICSQPIMP
jgi:hypothetical protein